jgi:hypothetical protein
MNINWIKTSPEIKYFNGCVQTAFSNNFEYGIFKEKYGAHKWTIRKRPIDKAYHATNSWGHALLFTKTKKELLTICENTKIIFKNT